jgi:DNA modification methylase
MSDWLTVHIGDNRVVLDTLPERSVHCVVTSPPYWGLRSYGVGTDNGELGLEATPEEYVANMVDVFRKVRRVLRDDGTLWLNLGDSYASSPPGNTTVGVSGASTLHGVNGASGRYRETLAAGHQMKRNTVVGGLKPKDLVGIPWRVAFALQADGWYLRSAVTWCKKAPMPESVTDRPSSATEMVFLLTKTARYYYDAEAVRTETGANLRNYWVLGPQPYPMVPIVRSEVVGADAVGGDIRRTGSRGCPLHGGRPVPAATAPDDGRASPSLDGSRSPDTFGHPEPGRLREHAPTAPLPDADSAGGSSDWTPLPYEPAATLHSSGSHRTVPAPATSRSYTPSDGSPVRTGDTSASPDDGEPSPHTSESSIGPDEMGARSPERSSSRTADTSSCTCTYRRYTTSSVSHFAVFPPALVEPCVKAGTSERGVCPECGAPWERVVERRPATPGQAPGYNRDSGARNDGDRAGHWTDAEVITSGWRPSCAHDAEPVPATVLDPFAGSGTVGVVANKLSRRAILIDLNPEYLEQIERRNLQAPLGLAG